MEGDANANHEPMTLQSARVARTGRVYWTVAASVMLVALFLRFTALDRYPLPIHQDELSNIYDAYSIATTGADRAGDRWPVLVRGMGPGDYRPALYAYCAIVTTKLWGFSTWAGRLPAALFGCLTVLFIFLFARRFLGSSGGLIALFFATFSPILILYGRQAHEGACLPPLFSILVIYLLLRAVEPENGVSAARRTLLWSAGAGLAIGLSVNAYGAQRLTGPLFALLGAGLIVLSIGLRRRAYKLCLSALLVLAFATALGALPQIYAAIDQPAEFFARAKTVGFNPHAGPRWWCAQLIRGYAAHFDPRGLLFDFGTYGELSVGRLSIAALPFLYLGLIAGAWRALARRETDSILLLASILICVLPATASGHNLAITRASGVWSLYPVACALGAITIGKLAQSVWRQSNPRHRDFCQGPARARNRAGTLALSAICAIIAVLGARNIAVYLAHPDWHDVVYQNHLVRMGQWLKDHDHGYQRVYVDTPGVFAYLYVAAFSGMPPAEFQRAPREGIVTRDGWEKFHRFGRFRFADLPTAQKDWLAGDQEESWLYLNAKGETITFHPDGKEERRTALAFRAAGASQDARQPVTNTGG
jgi:4-amino-4-deoxy-L-arabinose transferase-like glycosyltransferase